ncbi:hypothetical protein RCL1_005343 [Eukaryota sp. TZLM3-RCL]
MTIVFYLTLLLSLCACLELSIVLDAHNFIESDLTLSSDFSSCDTFNTVPMYESKSCSFEYEADTAFQIIFDVDNSTALSLFSHITDENNAHFHAELTSSTSLFIQSTLNNNNYAFGLGELSEDYILEYGEFSEYNSIELLEIFLTNEEEATSNLIDFSGTNIPKNFFPEFVDGFNSELIVIEDAPSQFSFTLKFESRETIMEYKCIHERGKLLVMANSEVPIDHFISIEKEATSTYNVVRVEMKL